jgi:hypothetical protein
VEVWSAETEPLLVADEEGKLVLPARTSHLAMAISRRRPPNAPTMAIANPITATHQRDGHQPAASPLDEMLKAPRVVEARLDAAAPPELAPDTEHGARRPRRLRRLSRAVAPARPAASPGARGGGALPRPRALNERSAMGEIEVLFGQVKPLRPCSARSRSFGAILYRAIALFAGRIQCPFTKIKTCILVLVATPRLHEILQLCPEHPREDRGLVMIFNF